jgi:hypothetical protein
MMRSTRIAGLCVAALCATFALTASSALAVNLPHYGKCEAQTGGKYKNGGCTKLAKTTAEQKFEWHPLTTTVPFTSKKIKETGNAVLESAGGTEISCTEQVGEEGEYGPGDQLKNIVSEFKHCEALGANTKRTSTAPTCEGSPAPPSPNSAAAPLRSSFAAASS